MTNVYPFRRGRSPDAVEPDLELDADSIAAGHGLLFEPTMRAAHIACLGLAQLTREDRWPDPQMVCDFARLYRVSAAELGAFFGLLSYADGRRMVWVDALRGPVHPHLALDRASPAMRKAFGFLGLATDVVAAESRA